MRLVSRGNVHMIAVLRIKFRSVFCVTVFCATVLCLTAGLTGVLVRVSHADEAGAELRPIVSTAQGRVSGVRLDATNQLTVFRGIPFAAPPVGDLRWKPPQLPASWNGIRRCEEFGKVAWQNMSGRSEPPEMSEDCLFLNVWTTSPGPETKRPVMVWIHGGGLNRGWSSQAKYDGSQLARQGVVLVSINYRLGALGFLAHPELSAESEQHVSGNYGLLDQIQALKWVRDNIAAFGGDPSNVTIFGESAGGTSVSALCASPLASGLFHRAIIQSPWMFGYINDLAEANVVKLRQPVSSTPSAEALGESWAADFVDQQSAQPVMQQLREIPAREFIEGRPYYKTRVTIDGSVLENHPAAVFAAGKQARVPVMIGTTKDEGAYFTGFLPPNRDEFEQTLRRFYGASSGAVISLYSSQAGGDYKSDGARFVTDAWFLHPTRQLLEGMKSIPVDAYQYQFIRPGEGSSDTGSPHAIELRFVFGTLGENASDAEQRVSDMMRAQWVKFAETGDPNGAGLPSWPSYRKQKQFLNIGDSAGIGMSLKQRQLDVHDHANRQLYE